MKVHNKVYNKVHNSYLASLKRLLLISPNGLKRLLLISLSLERLLQSFKVSRIRDACFTASLFFISPLVLNSYLGLRLKRLFAKRIYKILYSVSLWFSASGWFRWSRVPIANQDFVCLLWGDG